MELTVPATEFPDESARVKVLVMMVELSINSLNVAVMVVTSVVAPSDGVVEETVGAVVSISNEFIFNVTLLLELSVTVIVQSE